MDKPSAQELMDIGISRGHAYDILGGRQKPSLKTAFVIYDATGVKLGILEELDGETVEKLRPRAVA